MYIKFLAHGKGDPSKASSYLIDEVDHLNRPRPDIQVLRGDPQTFTALAQSIQNDWIYTSGVIAWSKSDNPTDAEVNEVLDAFEKHAFAGLQPNQYHFTAVLHEEDDGSKHVHFLVPRIELETQKALNIAPPGHEKYFDPLRDYFNYSKGWSRPDDPTLQRDTQTPDHVHFQDKSAVRAGLKDKPVNDIREMVGSYIAQRVEHGFIRNRKDVLEAVSELGTVTRTSDQFISLKIDGADKAIRLKGAFYESEFSIESYFENRTREADDVSTPSGHRVISAEHKQLALENSERIQELSARRSRYNTDRYFNLATSTAESRLDRDREPEPTQDLERTSTAEPSFTTTGTAVNHFNREQQHTAERADQTYQIHADSGNFPINPFAFSSSGEVNERIKNLDEPTSRLVEESNRRTEQVTETVREVHEAINRTKRAFDPRESSQIRVNFNAERADSKHQIEETIGRFFTDVRIQHESAFTNAVAESVRTIESTTYSQSSHSEQNQSITATTFGTDIETFIIEYSTKQRNERRRAVQQDTELRRLNQQLGETDRKLNVISRLLNHPKFAIRPKSSIEMTHYFKSIGYRSPTAKNIHSWSEKQHEAFRKGDINQVAYYIGCKYNELSHFSRYEKGLNRDEIDIVQKNLHNDERIIAYMQKKGCYLDYDRKVSVNRTLKLEKGENESRLNLLDKRENTVQPIVQVKPEPKALDQDNGFTM
jgi:hypothetical protein